MRTGERSACNSTLNSGRTFSTSVHGTILPACTARSTAANIPADVYHTLIQNVHAHLPVFHRYLDLRRRLLGVEELHYYDLYAPAAAGVELTYTFEEARELILASLAPLGESIRRGGPPRICRTMDGCLSERGENQRGIFERRGLRRPSVHSAELQRQV